MKEYLVIASMRYAARNWNPGERVSIPDERAEKLLADGKIQSVSTAAKESK